MLQELSVVEQRYLAVREVLDGAKVTDVASRHIPIGCFPALGDSHPSMSKPNSSLRRAT